MRNMQPGGTIEVSLWLNRPLKYYKDESCGARVAWKIRLRVNSV